VKLGDKYSDYSILLYPMPDPDTHAYVTLQYPKFRYKTEYPHAGLIHPGFIHGRHTSQCVGLVATSSPTTHKQSEEHC